VRGCGCGCVWGGFGLLLEVKNEVMGCCCCWMKGDMPLMFQLNSLSDWSACGSFCFFTTLVFAIRRRFSGGGDISRSIIAC
jgi:hypothetical protein